MGVLEDSLGALLAPCRRPGRLWGILGRSLGVPGRSLGAPWADRRRAWVSWEGPWGSLGCPWGVLEGLWGMLGLSGALLGGLGDPQSDPRSVFKRSRQDGKSLKKRWFLYYFQQLGRPWEPLEVSGGPWVVLRGALERVRRPKQRPGTARQSHRQPRGSPMGRRGGRQGIRGAPEGRLGGRCGEQGVARGARRVAVCARRVGTAE